MRETILACTDLGMQTIVPSLPGKCADCGKDIQYAATNLPMITSGRVITVCMWCVLERCKEKPPSDVRGTVNGRDVSLLEAATYWKAYRERN